MPSPRGNPSAPPGRSGLRRALENTALAAVSAAVALAGAEGLARVFVDPLPTVRIGPSSPIPAAPLGSEVLETEEQIDSFYLQTQGRGFRLRPNTRARIRREGTPEVEVETNSLGIRDRELGPKSDDEFRVLVLGDSITFGRAVSADETWTARMEALAGERRKRIHFVNAGITGASTAHEVHLFAEIGARVRPDLVVLQMYLNDAQESGYSSVRMLKEPWSRSRFLSWATLRLRSVEARLSSPVIPPALDPDWAESFRRGRTLKKGDPFNDRDAFDFELVSSPLDIGLGWNPRAWEIVSSGLDVLKRQARDAGCPLVAVIFPVHLQVMGTIEDDAPQRSCRRICEEHGVPLLDVLPPLRADWQSRHQRHFFDHCHPTPYGYERLAAWTVDWLDAGGWLPPRR